MPQLTDRTGLRYGRLTVLRKAARGTDAKSRITRWHCRCDCGAETVVRAADLTAGRTSSCGCLRAEMTGSAARIHGMSDSPEHRAWRAMRARCSNPNGQDYAYYGARGIVVCERWESFSCFLADMGPRPGPGYSIDRINVDGNYEPGNTRWATRKQQMRNTRRATWVVYEGVRMTLHDAAALCGIPGKALRQRYRHGWREPDLFLPIGSKRRLPAEATA